MTEYTKTDALVEADRYLRTRLSMLETVKHDLEQRKQTLKTISVEGDPTDTSVFIWAINDLENFTKTLDFNVAARISARLASTEEGSHE